MARKKVEPTPPQAPLALTVSRAEAESRVRDRIEKSKELLARPLASWEDIERVKKEYSKWSAFNTELLKRLFTNESISDEYTRFFGFMVAGDPTFAEKV